MVSKSSVNLFWIWGLAVSLSHVIALSGNPAFGQSEPIEADNTLGAESSRVIPLDSSGLPIDSIEGGAVRGGNLFHSFEKFNVQELRGAYFVNPSNEIQNIISRVTGNNPSEILGTLGIFNNPGITSSPNLIFSNPNGIVFGENASLDVGGSFVGTTADAVQFGEQGVFSATEPETPGNLTVNPSALFFDQVEASGGIINKSQANAGINLNGNEINGLRVPDSQSLLLVGGDINLDGGGLNALGGEIELAGLAGEGKLGLKIDDSNNLNLSIPDDIERADVSITNGAKVDVTAGNEGSITINARNLEIKERSLLLAGIREGSGTPEAQAGDITINAASKVLVDNQSYVSNDVKSGSFGKAGDVSISTGFLEVLNGAQIGTGTLGQGDAGSVNIVATDAIKLDGEGENSSLSGVFSLVASRAEGKAGDISISTNSLEILNGAQVNASTFGQGDAGSVKITADSIKFDGESKNRIPSGVKSQVQFTAKGKAGGISITTGSLEVINGAQLDASTFGEGNAGSLEITATDLVKFDGDFSGAVSTFGSNARGKAGDISITTNSLEVTNGAQIDASTFGEGNAGSVEITATDLVKFDGDYSWAVSSLGSNARGKAGDISISTGSLEVLNGAQIFTSTSGVGDAGSITINAADVVKFDGEGKNNGFPSGALSRVGSNAVGNAGDIFISAGSLEILNSAQISASTLGFGSAGMININATNSVKFDGQNNDGSPSGAFSRVLLGAEGKAGGVFISTGFFEVLNGAQVSAGIFGEGDAGNVEITATNLVKVDGEGKNSTSGIFSIVESSAKGNGGSIFISTDSLEILNSAQVSVGTFGEGDAGSVEINANDLVKIDGEGKKGNSSLSSAVSSGAKGKAGNVSIFTNNLEVLNGAQIGSGTFGQGNAGNVIINATGSIKFDGKDKDGFSSGAFSTLESGAEGKAGNILIDAELLEVTNDARLSASTFGKRDAGSIEINADIFEATQGGQVTTITYSSGKAGNINLNVKDKITFSGTGQRFISGLFASTSPESTGKGGSIFIDPRLVIIENGAGISVGSSGKGNAGNILLQAGTLQLKNGFITARTASTQGGNINLELGELLLLRNNSQISTTAGTAQTGGDGGNIDINSKIVVAIPKEDSNITANAFEGKGGNISIDTQGIFGIEPASTDILLSNDITASSELGITGNINLNAPDNSSIQNSLSDLQQNPIDTNALIANSCIARSRRQESTFNITGAGGLPQRPGDAAASNYPTGEVQNLSGKIQSSEWKPGEAIIEPQGVYELPSGKLILSRECS